MLSGSKNYLYLLLFWIILFVLYLPAANAGFVADFTGWLQEIRTSSFANYINRTHFSVKSLYQFTQFTTYIFYQLFGANAWCWHLLHVTLQAINAYLWFRLIYKLLSDSNIASSQGIALAGTLIFCVSPYLSEVIVWEPSFHYLQGFLMILLILHWVQKYHYTKANKYIWWSGIVFLLSTYSLEIFYLTPFFVFTLALYYRVALGYDKQIFRKILLLFVLPQVLLFIAHLVVFHTMYGSWLPHLRDEVMRHEWKYYLSKPAKYVFLVAGSGRFFQRETILKVYAACESYKAIYAVLLFLGTLLLLFIVRYKHLHTKGKALGLLYTWMLAILFIMSPLWLPEVQPYVFCDRYLYLLCAVIYIGGSLLLSMVVRPKLFWMIVLIYTSVQVYITYKMNKYWKQSAGIIHNLIYELPDAHNKTVLLLNMPENFKGVPMMDATPEGEYKLMHDEYISQPLTSQVYDVAASNMNNVNDGTHVRAVNDSTLTVTLNQWGTWWWYNRQGGISYENNEYRVDMRDQGHEYVLHLKRPSSNYIILYMTQQHWRTADMTDTATQF